MRKLAVLTCLSVGLITIMCSQRPSTADMGVDTPRIFGLLSRADSVFVGQISSIGECAAFYSGTAPSIQIVEYDETSFLKGTPFSDPVTVGHHIVHGAPWVSGESPCLDDKLFKIGTRVLVFGRLERKNGSVRPDLIALDGGVVLAQPNLVEELVRTASACADPREKALTLKIDRSLPLRPTLDVTSEKGESYAIGSELLQQFIGEGDYQIKSALISPSGEHIAVELHDLDVRTQVVVFSAHRNCPALLLSTQGAKMENRQFDAPPNYPKRPLWLTDSEIAFLVGWDEEIESLLYYQSLDGEKRVLELKNTPQSLRCDSGLLVAVEKNSEVHSTEIYCQESKAIGN